MYFFVDTFADGFDVGAPIEVGLGRDVVDLAEGVGYAEGLDKGVGDVVGVVEVEGAEAVAGDDDAFVGADAGDEAGVVAPEAGEGLAGSIDVGGAQDGDGELVVFEGLDEDLFGFRFVLAVLPGGVVGFGFVGGQLGEGAVDGCGAAEDVVFHIGVFEGVDGVLGGVGVESEHVDDGVGIDFFDGGFKGFEVVAINMDGFNFGG